jgi:ABC-type transporter Mla subunit MlaD
VTGTSRLPKIVLGILGVWGLLAALMLVHTLLATKQLHKRVTAITASVSEIDRETGSIGLMQETNRISGELLTATQPLPGTLDALRGVTGGLATKVGSILAGTTTIESNSQQIEGKVVGARDTAAAINGSVKGIGTSLGNILATLRSTEKAAGEINTSTKGIHSAVAALLPVTRDIDAGIGASNRGVAEAAVFVDAIRADIGNILAGLPDLLKHTRSIDCDSALTLLGSLLGPGEACNP